MIKNGQKQFDDDKGANLVTTQTEKQLKKQ